MKDKRKKRREEEEEELEEDKEHSTFFIERSVFPLRDAPPTNLEEAWRQHRKSGDDPNSQWRELGPFHIAGRVTSLVALPGDPNTMYAGSAGGGVWRTQDGGVTWSSAWQRFASNSIGSLLIDPGDGKSVIAGTGEANLSADTYAGDGVHVSRDGGKKWKPFVTVGHRSIPESLRDIVPRRVGVMAFDPNHVFALALGSVSLDVRMPAGLYVSDGSFRPCPALPLRSYNCHSILFPLKQPGVILAGLEMRGSLNGIFRIVKRGEEYTVARLESELPKGEVTGRISLAAAPSDPKILYALIAGRRSELVGVYRSENGGADWKQVLFGKQFPQERFMQYTNTIAVHPRDPGFVIWGGQSLYRTRDGGQKWSQITTRVPGPRNYVHEDHHALVILDGGKGGIVYSGNDGGVARSEDGGNTWEDRSQGMVTTMFYDIDVAPNDCTIFGGGSQDNGTLIGGVTGVTGDFVRAFTGDGGWIVFDGADAQRAFGSRQNLNVFRHDRGRPWGREGWVDVSPGDLEPAERAQRAIAVLAIDPPTRKGTKRVWAGSTRLWRTKNDGGKWKAVSPHFDGSVISAIEISSVDPDLVFVGTTKGGIYRSTNGGKDWSADLAGLDVPRRMITRIDTHPKEVGEVAISVASTGLPGAVLTPETVKPFRTFAGKQKKTPFKKAWSNIFVSRNQGETWDDIDRGILPNVVFYALVYETQKPFRLFVAGDVGVFACISEISKFDNPAWLSITGNLPNVVVSDLVYHHQTATLFAATYGRGIWSLDASKIGFVNEEGEFIQP